jgi:hypothetical protein
MQALKEVGKFVLRIVILMIPFIATMLADPAYGQWGALVSGILILIDKAIHESKIKLNGLVPF